MPYIVSLFRGDDPGAPAARIARADVVAALAETGHAEELGPSRWRYRRGGVRFQVRLGPGDELDEVPLRIGWSTSDELAEVLALCVELAERLGARAYDRNGKAYLTRERLAALGSGFSPAATPPP